MAAFVKSKLKAARDAINKKDFDTALSAAREVLSFESNNYNALLFSGVALFELKKDGDCEASYLSATKISPDQLHAWQGLLKLYERSKDTKKTLSTLETLLELYRKSEDPVKCGETVQKIIQLRRDNGTRREIISALKLQLPGSSVYDIISTPPTPDFTLPTATATFDVQVAVHNTLPVIEEIVSILEKEEEQAVASEVDRRRLRLNAGKPEDIRNEVGCAIWRASELPVLYEEILNHPSTPDELRRSIEAKLFRYKLRFMKALPHGADKLRLVNEVDEMIRGSVLISVPDELVWTENFETRDASTILDYKLEQLRQFVQLFPAAPLTRPIIGFFRCTELPLEEDTDDNEDEPSEPIDYDAEFQIILEGHNQSPHSILLHRMLRDLYLKERDYPNTIKICESGIRQVERVEKEWGRTLSNTNIAFHEAMATSLVHLFPPKHHARALGFTEFPLSQQPDNVPCLLARAYVFRYAQKYSEARSIFSRVVGIVDEDEDQLTSLEAKEEVAWCDSLAGQYVQAISGLRAVIEKLDTLDDQPERTAQAMWRLGKTLWDQNEHGSRADAYNLFIGALKKDASFAPAFTSLGIHYAEYVDPPDPIRASKCFQKAVELDSREGEAARRLAEGFADEREWDLVEVVARRTIEGEGGAEGDVVGNVAAAARYNPVNAWAWKAIGVVELNRSNFMPAITSLQIALRADDTDHCTWTRLGEAYSRSGRPAAALKALNRAHDLAPDDWTCQFFTADVYRQMGLFETAITMLEEILSRRPDEIGVLVALAESYLALGRSQFGTGFLSRAETSWASAVRVACDSLQSSSGYKRVAWKIIADASLELSTISLFTTIDTVASSVGALLSMIPSGSSTKLAGVSSFSKITSDVTDDLCGRSSGWLAAVAYHNRIHLCEDDDELKAAALYDYAIALFKISQSSESPQKESILGESSSSLKLALRSDPGNEAYWNAMGTVNFASNPKIAQHSFIKALELDPKNPSYWTNLGLLYLHNEDPELANHALYKAQVLNPEYSLAWVGQAFVAIANGHLPEAKAVLEHALTLPVQIPQAEYEYANHILGQLADPQLGPVLGPDQLVAPYFALRRYCGQFSQDASGLHLYALLCERLHQLDLAAELLAQAITLLERAYEQSEDAKTERRYAIANVNLGRVRLATGDYSGAKEAYDVTLGLLGTSEGESDAADGSSDVGAKLLRIQAEFGAGLANFKLGELEEALAAFESAAEGVPSGHEEVQGHIAILTAQTLWAIGGEEAEDAARAQLLDCINNDSENLGAVTALAAIGIMSGDDALVDASLSDILSTTPERRKMLDPARNVDRLLVLHHLLSGRTGEALDLLQSTLQQDPFSERARLNLAEHLVQTCQFAAARDILRPPVDEASPTLASAQAARDLLHEKLRVTAVALSKEEGGRTAEINEETENVRLDVELIPIIATRAAVRSVVLAPWEANNWTGLAYVQSESV